MKRTSTVWAWTCLSCVFLAACGASDSPGNRDSGTGGTGGEDSGLGIDAGVEIDASVRDVGMPDAPVVCGDRVVSGGEACDDSNTDDGDGCSADCSTVDPNFACVRAGDLCVRVVTCGNGRIEGPEICDDRNANPGDGCSASCQIEPGWACSVIGAACRAALCGDGIVAGFEACDDAGLCNGGGGTLCLSDADCTSAGDGTTCAASSGDGCNTNCEVEAGSVCPSTGGFCGRSTCGDTISEGTEECDDGNTQIGDGCTPFCTREPDCTDGTCVAVCGDGVVFAPETCDDANARSGDGCSAACQEEIGFTCDEVPLPDPMTVQLPVVVRDFIPTCRDGDNTVTTRLAVGVANATPPYGHPDFQCFSGAATGMVQTALVDGRPVRAPNGVRLSSDASFDLWYRSDDDYNRTVAQRMTLARTGAGTYQFDSTAFFPLSQPLDGSPVSGFPTLGLEALVHGGRNFFFTSEVRFWFQYSGTETLAFSGDDDVWVFINNRLAVDIGGVHGRMDGSITLSQCASATPANNASTCPSALDLRVGGIYEAVVFQAERHTTASQYRLTLANFVRAPSTCRSTCGDGVLAADEACDNGTDNTAVYDGCGIGCVQTPYCGDGVIQTIYGETCDDGRNLGAKAEDCAPGCQSMGARCGDGVVQTEAGEQCDDSNTMGGDECSAECQFELG